MQFRFEDCHRTFRRPVSVIPNVHVSIAGTRSFIDTQNGFLFGTSASGKSRRQLQQRFSRNMRAEAVCLVSRVSCDKPTERKYHGILTKRTGGSVLMYVQNRQTSTWRQCNNRWLEAPWRPGDSRKLDNVCERRYHEALFSTCSKYTVRHGSSFRRLQQRKRNRSKSKCNSVNKVQCST